MPQGITNHICFSHTFLGGFAAPIPLLVPKPSKDAFNEQTESFAAPLKDTAPGRPDCFSGCVGTYRLLGQAVYRTEVFIKLLDGRLFPGAMDRFLHGKKNFLHSAD